MSNAITDKERARAAQAAHLGSLAPDGPRLERFNAMQMAAALEQEAARANLLGRFEGTPGKVEIHMDPRDALMLAEFLRKHGS